MSYETPPPPPPPGATDRLSTIRTYILIAFIFSLAFFVILPAIVYLVLFGVSVIVFLRIWKMYKAVNAGDIATLKATSNMMWAILALIFAGVIPGIMLIISDAPIKQL